MAFIHNNQFYYTTGIDSDNNRLKETWKYQLSTGLDNNMSEESVTVFPNPASEWVQISFKAFSNPSPLYCEASDSTGRMIWSGSMNSGNESLDVSGWPKGIYVIQLQFERGTISKKLVVE